MRSIKVALIACILLGLAACENPDLAKTPTEAIESYFRMADFLADPKNISPKPGSQDEETLLRIRKDFPALFIDEQGELYFSNFYFDFRPTAHEIMAMREDGLTTYITIKLSHIEVIRLGNIDHRETINHTLDFIVLHHKGGWRLANIDGWPPTPETPPLQKSTPVQPTGTSR